MTPNSLLNNPYSFKGLIPNIGLFPAYPSICGPGPASRTFNEFYTSIIPRYTIVHVRLIKYGLTKAYKP